VGAKRRGLKPVFAASMILAVGLGLLEHALGLPSASSFSVLTEPLGVRIYYHRAVILALLAVLAVASALRVEARRKEVRPLYFLGFWLLELAVWASSYLMGRALGGGPWITAKHPLCSSLGYIAWPLTIPIPFLVGPLLLLIARWLDLELSMKAPELAI